MNEYETDKIARSSTLQKEMLISPRYTCDNIHAEANCVSMVSKRAIVCITSSHVTAFFGAQKARFNYLLNKIAANPSLG